MIVPMKKITIIVQEKDAQEAVRKLRSLGLLHIEYQQEPKGKDINLIREELALIDQAIEVLRKAELATGCEGTLPRKDLQDYKLAASHIIDSWKRLDQLEEFSRSLILSIGEWEAWGDFDPHLINELAKQGIYVRLFQVPKKELHKLPSDAVVKVIYTKANMVYCLVISRQKFECAFKQIGLPKMGLSAMRRRLAEDRRVIEAIRDDLRSFFCQLPYFIQIKEAKEKELAFHQVVSGMGLTGTLSYIVGFIPVDAETKLASMAKRERWGFYSTDPTSEDRVPTLLRNPRWISLIKPVFKLLEIVPGYKELDISFWFLIFFSVFFGMIIGDAGYGAIYALLTYFAQRRYSKKTKDKSIFFLFYLLSFCAMIWGLLTGSVFGTELLKGYIRPLLPALAESRNVQVLCFFIGALHLSIAHFWRFVLKAPALAALAETGWILILWGVFFLAKFLILGQAFPVAAKWFFVSGIGLVILFTNPQRNIFKAFGSGLGNVLLNLTSNFTDVVSYVRIFAVSMAGVAVADAFTLMAREVGFNNFFTGFFSSLILIVGHGLNILLGPISVLVHGVRLNVLEFCSHANVKWSGFSYRPFSEENK